MTPIKRRLLYIFRDTLLRLRITWDHGNALTLSVGYHVDRTDAKGKPKWDGMRCKINTSHGKDKVSAAIINKELEEIEDRVNKAFYIFESSDTVPTQDQLKRLLSPEKSKQNIWPYYLDFIREGTALHQWSENTVKSIRQIEKLVRKFDPDVKFENLTKEWSDRFIIYQQRHKLSENKFSNEAEGYSNKVIEKNMRVFRWFLKWAVEKGHIQPAILGAFHTSLKTIEKPVIFLEWEELMRLYNYDFGEEYGYNQARDFFCFCCFSSLRFSDASTLRKSQISDNSFTITTQKTSDTIIIDLNKYSKAILGKYKDQPGELALPPMKLSTLNKALKKMGRLIGLDTPVHFSQYYGANRVEQTVPKYELLASHCGRRTFICNAIGPMNIPLTIVMEWTGHSEFSSLKPYMAIANKTRKNSMKKFDSYEPENDTEVENKD